MSTTGHARTQEPPIGPLGIIGLDHVEFWVGSARHVADALCRSFGFDHIAHSARPLLEIGGDRVSHALSQGEAVILVTGSIRPDSPVGRHVRRHGDGVRTIALRVRDARAAFEIALERGATSVEPIMVCEDGAARTVSASIGAPDDTTYSFVERHGPMCWPGFEATSPDRIRTPIGVEAIDHIAVVTAHDGRKPYLDWCEGVLGLTCMDQLGPTEVAAGSTAFRLSTLADPASLLLFAVCEPSSASGNGQIEEFLTFHKGPGVQHIAFRGSDILSMVRGMLARGVSFVRGDLDGRYYEDARQRLKDVDLAWAEIEELGILVDRDDGGYLLQIFCTSMFDRPTMFVEIIQRAGAKGFGENNVRALSVAVESERRRIG